VNSEEVDDPDMKGERGEVPLEEVEETDMSERIVSLRM
jgi:hypothetical protein